MEVLKKEKDKDMIDRDKVSGLKYLIMADRQITCPYYLDFKKNVIHLFGSKEASALILCGSDVQLYLEQFS